jgi:hypothetical protein
MAELLISNSQLAFYISSFTDETLIRRKDNKISAGIVFSLFNPFYSCRDIAPTHVTIFYSCCDIVPHLTPFISQSEVVNVIIVFMV